MLEMLRDAFECGAEVICVGCCDLHWGQGQMAYTMPMRSYGADEGGCRLQGEVQYCTWHGDSSVRVGVDSQQ